MRPLLALDLGTKCGWAIRDFDGRIESGVQVFELKRGESPGMRFIHFNRWLGEMMDRPDPKYYIKNLLVCYEQPLGRFAKGGSATDIAVGFQTRVEEGCAARGLDYFPLHASTLKKFATSKGNADKATVVKAVIERKWWPHREGERGELDHNQADAIALLHYAIEELKA